MEFCIVESRRIVAYRQAISCLVALSGDVRWNSVPSCPVALSCADDEVMSSRIVKSCAVLSHCQVMCRGIMSSRIVSYCSVFVWSCRIVSSGGGLSSRIVLSYIVMYCLVRSHCQVVSGRVKFRAVSFGLVMSHCHVVCVMSRYVALLSTVPSCSVLSQSKVK